MGNKRITQARRLSCRTKAHKLVIRDRDVQHVSQGWRLSDVLKGTEYIEYDAIEEYERRSRIARAIEDGYADVKDWEEE